MANFKYKALSLDGVNVTGVVEAYDEFEAIDKIKETCGVVTSLQSVDEKKTGILSINIGGMKAKEKTLALMCSQFAILLQSGLPIVRCVEVIGDQTSDKILKSVLKQVAEDVSSGYGLAQSFENKGKKTLPTTFVETVRSGEESGNLEMSFRKLYRYYDNSAKTKAKVRSAMMYPMILAILAVVVVAVLMTTLIPAFADTFEVLGAEMPIITQILMDLSDFLVQNGLYLFIGILAIVIALKLWGKTEKGRMFFARLSLRLPVLGKVAVMKGASQLSNTMNTMLSSGLSIVRAASICSRVLDNYHLGTQLGLAVVGLEEGKPLGTCLRSCECFPELLVEMAAVGDESGALEETLETIGVYFDGEVQTATQRALSLLQPIITIVMGVMICFILLALYLPIFTIQGAL